MQLLNVSRILKNTPSGGELPSVKQFIKRTFLIAWPSTLESFLISLVSLVDIIMVSTLGTSAIASVGLTTQPKFIGLAVFLSLNVAVSALVARRYGEKDQERANRILGQALVLTLGLTAIISVLCVAFADPILHLAGSAPDTHEDAVAYFRIIMGGMVFNVLTMLVNAAQRGVGNTKIAMRTNMVSNAVNVVFDYLLIGGHFGFPKLGVAGAAVATVLGTVCAFIMCLFSLMKKGMFLDLRKILRSWRFDKKTLGSIFNIGSSTFVEQIFLRVGFLTYAIIVANLGTVAFAAHQVGMNIMTISFSFGDGLSAAAVALIGQSLGEKRPDKAKIYGSVCQRFGLTCALCLSPIYLIFGRNIFSWFSSDEQILAYGAMIMTIMTFVVFLQISQVIYSGCLRGAGDTRYTAFVSLISVAIIRPLSGYLLCYPMGLGLLGAWLGLLFDQFMRFVMTAVRFVHGHWRHIHI